MWTGETHLGWGRALGWTSAFLQTNHTITLFIHIRLFFGGVERDWFASILMLKKYAPDASFEGENDARYLCMSVFRLSRFCFEPFLKVRTHEVSDGEVRMRFHCAVSVVNACSSSKAFVIKAHAEWEFKT